MGAANSWLRRQRRGGNLTATMSPPTVKRRTKLEQFVAAAGLAAVLAAANVRQGAAADQDTASCARVPTAAERLACYDRATPPTAPSSEIAPPVAPPGSAPLQPSPAAESGTAAVAPSGGTADEKPEVTSVVVVGMRKYPGRSAIFTTDKGDVWIQIGAESVYLPKVPFEAELRPASMGAYFLRPSDYGWRVHVRRND
jgi:hypothetical protein